MDYSSTSIWKYLNQVTNHLNINTAPNTNTRQFLKGMLDITTHLLNQWGRVPLNIREQIGGPDPYEQVPLQLTKATKNE